jgi:hypothetical protein
MVGSHATQHHSAEEMPMNSIRVGQQCRVRNAEVRDPRTGARLYNRTGVIAEQYENEGRMVLLVRMEGIAERVCLLLTDVEVCSGSEDGVPSGRPLEPS